MRCPYCNEESFAKKKLIRDGWRITGEVSVCALCGRELPAAGKSDGPSGADDAKKRKLAALLGGEEPVSIKLAGTADRKFCRNCRHFIVHPFRSVCALTDRDADPMGECGSFAERPATEHP